MLVTAAEISFFTTKPLSIAAAEYIAHIHGNQLPVIPYMVCLTLSTGTPASHTTD